MISNLFSYFLDELNSDPQGEKSHNTLLYKDTKFSLFVKSLGTQEIGSLC